MRKVWLVLLSVAIVMAFALPAAAVDVKFSGQYYAWGWYIANNSIMDESAPTVGNTSSDNRGSAALVSQRLRVATEFKVAEGLKLVTRFDALERMWGNRNWRGSSGETQSQTQEPVDKLGATNAYAQQNIEFERAYVDFTVPIGQFQVGYQEWMMWGTPFLNSPLTFPGVKYWYTAGNLKLMLAWEKRLEENTLANSEGTNAQYSDTDKDVYDIGLIYKFKSGEVGLLYQYSHDSSNRKAGTPYKTTLSFIDPYVKFTAGGLYVEAEGYYGFGKLKKYEAPATSPDVDVKNAWGLYVNAKYDFKPFYAGLQFIYMSGDALDDDTEVNGSMGYALRANYGFDRCLILWNSAYFDNMGSMRGNATSSNPRTGEPYYITQFMDNVWFYQLYAGWKVTPKLNLHLALSYAKADEKPRTAVKGTQYVDDEYGTELDLIAKYKIFDNLEYMVGAGYLWTGDYFKGTDAGAKIDDNYIIMHKLTLNF